ncbi:MAG: hypothetical protein II841_04955 [Bacteroidales bacterium]|nr:hypothetical protein [Bacteroidales bacterium]
MKNFIKKIVGWILAAYAWFVGLLNKVRRDRLYHFIAGLIIGAFCAMVLHVEWAWWPVLIVAFIKEFIDLWQDGNFDLVDLLATVSGGLLMWLFQFLDGWLKIGG